MDSKPIPRFVNYNLVFLGVVLVLIFLTVLSYNRFNESRESARLVNQSYLVKLRIVEAFGLLRDAEAGQRGHILTKDSVFLVQVRSAEQLMARLIKDLDSLVVDSAQDANLEKYKSLLLARMARLNTVLEAATHDDVNWQELLVPGLDYSGQVGNQIQTMLKLQDEILQRRIEARRMEEKRSSLLILAVSLFSLLVLVVSYLRIRKEVAARTKQEFNARHLEAKVNERTADLQRLNAVLNEQNNQLEKKNQELNSFTYIASHDLKEPLRKISIFSQLILENESLTPSGERSFTRILESSRRMQALIGSIFSYAQADAKRMIEPVDFLEIVRKAMTQLEDTVVEKGAVFELEPLPVVPVIRQQMEQLVENLFSNALKYSRPGVKPHIRVSAESVTEGANPGWKIHVSDNGMGFDNQFSETIFEIFKRLHSDHEIPGTGIGLAICRKVAQNHSGWITATSSEGSGSTFTVFIPRQT